MSRIISDLTITDYTTEDTVEIPKKYVTYFDVLGNGETNITIQIGENKTHDIFYLLKNNKGKAFNLDFVHEEDGIKTTGTYVLKEFHANEKIEGVIEINLKMQWLP